MPWTYTFHRQAMLNRTTRILKPIAFRTRFHGETIKMLWLKRSCYDLKRSQRFHAKTSPLQWLKTKCYDLTLPLVFQIPVRYSEIPPSCTQSHVIKTGWDKSAGSISSSASVHWSIRIRQLSIGMYIYIHSVRSIRLKETPPATPIRMGNSFIPEKLSGYCGVNVCLVLSS